MDAEPMRDRECRTLPHIRAQFGIVEPRLQLIRRQHHDDVGPFCRLGIGHDLEAGILGLCRRGRARAQRNDDVLDAAVAQIVGMGVALAAIADDGNLLRLDQIHIRVAVVINPHLPAPLESIHHEGTKVTKKKVLPRRPQRLRSVRRGLLYDLSASSASSAVKCCPSCSSCLRGENRENRHSNCPGPRAIATVPVRDTSTRPKGSISVMKALSFSLDPVISNTKLSVVESTTRARKISARRNDSIRASPLPATLISAISRSTEGPSSVKSCTLCTGTRRDSCALICSMIIGVPLVTIVMRDRLLLRSTSATVRLSIL